MAHKKFMKPKRKLYEKCAPRVPRQGINTAILNKVEHNVHT